ncbi:MULTISPECIES: hypothetical protein [Olivibacter]|uniref:Uncharacterized protein n=1 Tax=Olivibacter jilunii TaxID=985016 RepID=A0ABW6B4N5_9SPHI|nr:hypothetical protein [Olivibacter sp. LS-1]MCL4640560.1 hypothetical protein [Olivibacter sp. UJ_SKK_5.1]MDX3914930.1 hypothetical protein [Pseudosphingobacterium sp.]QEL03539.1 hypothetical protein FKG96_22795 [Olivibacter sp. LS-1]
MVRKTLVYLLLFTLTFQCLGSLGVLTWFQVNRNYIIRALCENRDKPEMQCNGQCVLMKKLKKLEESEKGSRGAASSKAEVTMVVSEMLHLQSPFPVHLSENHPSYGILYRYLYTNKPFLPPKII